MDEWQLTHLALSFVLPLRPEDCAGLLIGDVDFEGNYLRFGTRFEGRDFNKGRQSFTVPIPLQLTPLLQIAIGDRVSGPVLRSRTVFEGRRNPELEIATGRRALDHIEAAIAQATHQELKTAQDQKKLVRRTIRQMGGVSERELTREFSKVIGSGGSQDAGRFYDLRSATSTELERAGVSHLVQRYVTGHTTSDILNVYVALDPATEMQKYFKMIQPLLDAMLSRANQLGLRLPE